MKAAGATLLRTASFAGMLLLLFVCAAPSTAQVVTGRVLDGTNRQPVILAHVALVDSVGTVLDETFSDHEGRYRLATRQPGAYYMVVQALGYLPAADGVLELGRGGFMPADFYLRPEPIELAGLTATAERVERHLENQGFYRRMAAGFGHFVTPKELENAPVRDMVEFLQRLPGVQQRMVSGFAGLFMTHHGPPASLTQPGAQAPDPPGLCTPVLYIDGMRVNDPEPGASGVRLDLLVDFESVLAVEVYTRGVQIPLQYAMSNSCGVILVWTK